MAYQPKSYRKFVATTATAAMVASAVAPVVSAASFTDVAPQYKDAIDFLVSTGATKGKTETKFGVYDEITRLDAAVILARVLKLDVDNAKDAGFTDVPKDRAKYVNALVDAGILDGKEDGKFGAYENLTRVQMAKIIANAYKLKADDVELPFTDVNDTWAPFVKALYKNGVTKGKTETKFGAYENITRGDFAVFVYRAANVNVAPQVVSVSAINYKTVKLTGSALDKLNAGQLSLEGNKVVSVTPSEDGKEATVVFEKPFESGKEQVLKLTEKVEGEADKVTEFKFTFTLDVKSVEVTSNRVDDDTEKQFLGFTINGGEPVSAQYLKDSGYTVEFQSTVDVFKDASTGELDPTKLAGVNKFVYKVVLTKGDVTLESELKEVEVIDFATHISSINEVSLTQGNVNVKSNKLTVEDGPATLAVTKASSVNGTTINNPTVTYKSSNPAVAAVNATTGVITPIKPGTVTITITADDAKKEIPLTIVSGAREASKVTATSNSVKLLAGKAQNIDLTVTDQYGDEYEGDLTVASKDDTIATANGTVSFTDGKAQATITAVAKGNTVVEVKAGTKVLSTINVAVSDDNVVASRKVETVSPSADYQLDVVAGSQDKSVDLVWNQYNAGGFLIGPETDYTNVGGQKYTVSSSDSNVLDVNVKPDGTITVNALKAGTAKVLIKEGTVTRASVTINVVDTTPKITAVNFETVEDVTTQGALSVQVLKPEGITLSSTDYKAEIATDGTIFVDVEGTSAGYDAGDIKLGVLDAVYSGKDTDITGLDVNSGSVVATNVAAGAEGTIVVRVVREGETAAFATSTINVKVPQ
ncbi:S-layer homology domain-containing protein [Parageobacillus toebii]|uniref:S-layer homology domain-containing protein n=1 Tax=Parageobacillus toebii TaxID=153151 RepID=UPI002E1C4F0B|nr:S-layer homology domain-containing protein [Parageobacillus toebii]